MIRRSIRFQKSHSQAVDQPFGEGGGARSAASASAEATRRAEEKAGDVAADVQTLRKDLDGLREAISSFLSHTADRTAQAAQSAATSVKDRTGAAASKLAEEGAMIAAEATDHAKGAAAELEQIARRNPLSAIAAAAAIGLIIGMMGRRR